jgi:hypothetical protein
MSRTTGRAICSSSRYLLYYKRMNESRHVRAYEHMTDHLSFLHSTRPANMLFSCSESLVDVTNRRQRFIVESD